jgi:L-iditol 2-dehydrogenase
MRALLLEDYRRLRVCDFPDPEVGPEDVLIRVKACGICGSDVHGYDGSSGRRIPPLVMGHEAAGVIERVGDQVDRFEVGDHVTFDSTIYCGRCAACRQGRVNLCDHRMVLGVSCDDYRRHGALAEYVAVPQRVVYRLPQGLCFEHAALVEPVSIAFHAVRRTSIALGDSAAVVGAGMIGLLVIQALRAAGCGRVLAIDLVDAKLELARQLGADDVINAGACDASAELMNRTDGRGVDHSIEVVGLDSSVASAMAMARKGGTVTLVGNLAAQVELPLQAVVTRELTLYGSCASAGEYPACLAMMARGTIDVAPLISAVVPLDEAPHWFDRLYEDSSGLLKVLVQP